MTLLPVPRRFGSTGSPTLPSYQSGFFGLNQSFQAVTPSSTANAKGSFASLGTLTSAIDALQLTFGGSSNGGRHYNLDLDIGGAVFAANLSLNFSYNGHGSLYLPVRIPPGVLSARLACNGGSIALNMLAFGYQTTPQETATLIVPIGAVGSDTRQNGVTVTVGTSPSWTQINAAPTSNAFKGLIFNIGTETDNVAAGRTSATYIVELGIGPDSGSITSLGVQFLIMSGTQNLFGDEAQPNIPISIPAGSTLWVRITSNNAAADLCNVQLHGIR